TTIIISIATITLIATLIAKAAIGSTIRNIVETRPMGTGKRRINSVVKELVAQVVTDPVLGGLEIVLAEVEQASQAQVNVRVEAELETDPVEAELETDPVVEEPEIAPVEVDLLIVLVVEALAIVPAAAELETDPVVAGLLTVLEVVERVRVPVAVGPARDHQLDHLAVPPRTRLVIAVHRRDLVPVLEGPVLEVVDLAGAVETTR